MSLSDKEKELVKKAKNRFVEINNSVKDFRENEYPNYSFEQKVEYWTSTIHSGMRFHGESTGDPYNEFSKATYENWLSFEPNFDSVFEQVIHKLDDFDISEYKRRIGL